MSALNPILNCLKYIESFLKIVTKENSLIPFLLNEPQMRLYNEIKKQWKAKQPVRIIILKARQMGFSTLTEAILFWMAATACNVRCLIVAHKEQATSGIFGMAKTFYENLPPRLKPMRKACNGQQMIFDTPSHYKGQSKGLHSEITCATAGGSGIGRGTTLKGVHLSEFAFWPGDKHATLIGLLQAVPNLPGTVVIIESTANGYDEFKKQWDAAEEAQRTGAPGFTPIFFAWHEMSSYRMPVPPRFQRTEEEEELAETYHLDDEQLMWRRWTIANACGGDLNTFHQEYPSCPEEAFLATGECVFDKEKIILRCSQVRNLPWEYGSFRIRHGYDGKILSWEWEPRARSPIKILKAPEEGVPYVIGADTAGTGSDYFAAHVLDNRDGSQVAVLHRQKMGEREFAEQLYCLGMYYNTALIGVEVNYSTFPEMVLEELSYPHLYVRQRMDTYTGRLVDAFGFDTNSKTRPAIIDEAKDVAAHAIETINDIETLQEMLVFVYNDQWRPEAEVGEHDDLVMSFAISQHIRSQQTAKVKGETGTEPRRRPWTADMRADFQRADAEGKRYLISQWGNPS